MTYKRYDPVIYTRLSYSSTTLRTYFKYVGIYELFTNIYVLQHNQ
jgi:hypothetical protein